MSWTASTALMGLSLSVILLSACSRPGTASAVESNDLTRGASARDLRAQELVPGDEILVVGATGIVFTHGSDREAREVNYEACATPSSPWTAGRCAWR